MLRSIENIQQCRRQCSMQTAKCWEYLHTLHTFMRKLYWGVHKLVEILEVWGRGGGLFLCSTNGNSGEEGGGGEGGLRGQK